MSSHHSTATDSSKTDPSIQNITSWGQLGHLTPEQEGHLVNFQSQANPEDLAMAKYTAETTPQCCLRFLRARQFDVKKALTLLSDCVNKLKEMNAPYWARQTPDDCANCDIEALQNFYPHTQCGFDRYNRPILFEHTGGMNPSAILQMASKKNLINYHWWSMETRLDQMFTEAAARLAAGGGGEHAGPMPNISTCVVLDLKDVGMAHVSQKMLDQMKLYIGLDNICYPELLGKMLVVNAPYLAVQTWAVVKRWLDPRTVHKIEILGPGAPTETRLLEFISPENLPKKLGGTAPDLFFKLENAEALPVPRNGKLVKVFTVPADRGFSIDSYVSEGPIEITITFSSASVKTPQGIAPPVLVKPPPAAEDGPARNKQVFSVFPEERQITVTWANASKFSSRPLVYVFRVVDEHGESVTKPAPKTEAMEAAAAAAAAAAEEEEENRKAGTTDEGQEGTEAGAGGKEEAEKEKEEGAENEGDKEKVKEKVKEEEGDKEKEVTAIGNDVGAGKATSGEAAAAAESR